MKVFSRLVFASMALLLISMSFSQTVNAEDVEKEAPDFSEEELKQIEEESNEIRPYVNSDGKYIEFNEEDAIKDGIDQELVERTTQDVEKTNAIIANGVSTFATASCGGINAVNDNWYDTVIYLDSCKANQLSSALYAGAGAATIASIIPGAQIPAAVIGGLSGIAAASIDSGNTGNTGIRMRLTNSGDLYWIQSQ